jgi:hypothetical protein
MRGRMFTASTVAPRQPAHASASKNRSRATPHRLLLWMGLIDSGGEAHSDRRIAIAARRFAVTRWIQPRRHFTLDGRTCSSPVQLCRSQHSLAGLAAPRWSHGAWPGGRPNVSPRGTGGRDASLGQRSPHRKDGDNNARNRSACGSAVRSIIPASQSAFGRQFCSQLEPTAVSSDRAPATRGPFSLLD